MGELARQTIRVEWKGLLGWTLSTLALVVAVAAFFPAIKGNSAVTGSFDSLPPSVQAAFGIADLGSAAGYLQGQLFSTLGPLIFLSFAIGRGARAIAGEEEAGTLDLLLSYPLARRSALLAKLAAAVLLLAVLGAVVFVAIAGSSAIFGLDVPVTNVAAAVLGAVLLAVLFAALALLVGAATGSRALAIAVAAAAAVASNGAAGEPAAEVATGGAATGVPGAVAAGAVAAGAVAVGCG